MNVLSSRVRAAAAASAAAFALAACGGGTGGSALPPANPGAAANAPTTQQQQQQAATVTAMQQVRVQQWETKYVGSALAPTRFRKSVQTHARRTFSSTPAPSASPSASPSPAPSATPANCDGGSQETVTQNADGSITIAETGFYDSACTTLMYQSSNTISAPDSSGKMTGKGQETDYASDGTTVSEYDVLSSVIYNANPGSGDMSMSIARYPNQTAAAPANAVASDTDYFAYVDTSANGQNVGAASITQDPAFPGGELASVSTYSTTYTGGLFQTNQTIKVSGSTTNLVDHAGKLAVAVNPLAAGQYQWSVTGGSTIDTATETETTTTDDTGKMLSYIDTIVDGADDLTTTITGNAGGTKFTGILKQTSTGATLATFVVDADGNGSITFSNGTTLPVENWCWN